MRCRHARDKRCLGRERGIVLAALVLGFGGCLGTSSAQAEDSHSFDSVLQMLNLKAPPGTTPDFVEKTRPGATDYLPIGTKHAERPIKKKSPTDVKAAEAELDAARAQQERRAGLRPAAPASATPKKRAARKPQAQAAVPATQN